MMPYEKLAAVYDEIGHDRFSVQMVKYTLKILKKLKAEPITGLDLCCGTGTAIQLLSEHGITMSGLDGSQEMLAIARKKLRQRRLPLYCQRLPRFEIKSSDSAGRTRLERYDLVTCFFDSLNYLLGERELVAAFRSVRRHLNPGGWFIFDMNTPYQLSTAQKEQDTYAGVGDAAAWYFRASQSDRPERTNFVLTFFQKKGRGWERVDETHVQQGYANQTVRRLLVEAGLQVKGLYRCLSFVRPQTKTARICVVARRAG